jgi:hypothetical protein
MVDTINKRRTHYEVLGLEPTATSDEIERAFAGAISIFQPHGFGGVAEASVAFRTLRDPARRRAYDVSLGLGPEPAPRQSPMSWRVGGQFMTATATPAMRPVSSRPTPPEPPEPQVEAQPRLEAPGEPPIVPFIAATLRELASPEPLRETVRVKSAAIPSVPNPRPAPPNREAGRTAEGDRRVYLALNGAPGDAEEERIPWKRTGIVVGALTAAVALLGAWAGWESVSDAEPVQNAAKVVLPPPTTYTVSDPVAVTPDRVLDDARPLSRKPAHAAARVVRSRPKPGLADLERQLSKPDPTPVEATAGPSAPAEAPTAVAASLPLPNRVIARTIERIGYPCGQIASTTQGGAPGVFRVTCTSGHSYQAAPVRGRYHFRHLGSG